jgi:hypothetical protein
LQKDLPVEEMEKLMLTNTQSATTTSWRSPTAWPGGEFLPCAVPLERVFLIAPKLEAPKPDDKLKGSRTDFALK